MITHKLPIDVLNRLAVGDGDTLGVLRASQRSKRLLLLHEAVSAARSRAPEVFAEAQAEEALAVLVAAQRHSPSEVDALLLNPHIGAWGMHCLSVLLHDNDISSTDIGHLGAIAACAAVRAGIRFEVTTYLQDGSVMFPSFGLARLSVIDGWHRVRSCPGGRGVEILVQGTRVTVNFESHGTESWLPLRQLRSSAQDMELNIHLDDVNPYRDCGHLPVATRLGETAVQDWQRSLDDAWTLLVQEHRVSAEAIAEGVKSIVPLCPSLEAIELSATCHQAIGAVAATPPRNSTTLALALVHEFQHTKLSALLDLVPLIEPSSSSEFFYAPWRADPRPLRGLLHGVYAYLGLTLFWERHRRSISVENEESSNNLAHFEFALSRHQVAEALRTLQRSDQLTPPGQRFAKGMRQQVSRLLSLPVPHQPLSLARSACFDSRISWRLRNVRLDPDQIADWADAWLFGKTCSSESQMQTLVVDGRGPSPADGRLALFRQCLGFPNAERHGTKNATPADLYMVEGRLVESINTYRSQIGRSPDDLASWAGLALAYQHTSRNTLWPLAEHPEQVHALYKAILNRTGNAPDVECLAAWIAS